MTIHALQHGQFIDTGCQRLISGTEQPRIVDGNGGLPCERIQYIEVHFRKQSGPHTVVHVGHAYDFPAYPQWTCHNTAECVRDNALLPRETWIVLGIGRDNAAGNGPAERKRPRIERGLIEVAGHADVQIAVIVKQHQEAALGPGQLDDGVHHLIEHRLQVQRRADDAAYVIQFGKAFLLNRRFAFFR